MTSHNECFLLVLLEAQALRFCLLMLRLSRMAKKILSTQKIGCLKYPQMKHSTFANAKSSSKINKSKKLSKKWVKSTYKCSQVSVLDAGWSNGEHVFKSLQQILLAYKTIALFSCIQIFLVPQLGRLPYQCSKNNSLIKIWNAGLIAKGLQQSKTSWLLHFLAMCTWILELYFILRTRSLVSHLY